MTRAQMLGWVPGANAIKVTDDWPVQFPGAKRIAVTVMAAAAASALSSPVALGGAQAPVLGAKGAFSYGKGFGKVKPREVYLGGDATGDVKSLTWHKWSSGHAVG